jgi:hypothetical protein
MPDNRLGAIVSLRLAIYSLGIFYQGIAYYTQDPL